MLLRSRPPTVAVSYARCCLPHPLLPPSPSAVSPPGAASPALLHPPPLLHSPALLHPPSLLPPPIFIAFPRPWLVTLTRRPPISGAATRGWGGGRQLGRPPRAGGSSIGGIRGWPCCRMPQQGCRPAVRRWLAAGTAPLVGTTASGAPKSSGGVLSNRSERANTAASKGGGEDSLKGARRRSAGRGLRPAAMAAASSWGGGYSSSVGRAGARPRQTVTQGHEQ